MSTNLTDDLPEALKTVRTQPLFVMRLDSHSQIVGATPGELDKGEAVDPAHYYFRINPIFETAAPQYDWINRIMAVGIGDRRADGPVYSVFEIL